MKKYNIQELYKSIESNKSFIINTGTGTLDDVLDIGNAAIITSVSKELQRSFLLHLMSCILSNNENITVNWFSNIYDRFYLVSGLISAMAHTGKRFEEIDKILSTRNIYIYEDADNTNVILREVEINSDTTSIFIIDDLANLDEVLSTCDSLINIYNTVKSNGQYIFFTGMLDDGDYYWKDHSDILINVYTEQSANKNVTVEFSDRWGRQLPTIDFKL